MERGSLGNEERWGEVVDLQRNRGDGGHRVRNLRAGEKLWSWVAQLKLFLIAENSAVKISTSAYFVNINTLSDDQLKICCSE